MTAVTVYDYHQWREWPQAGKIRPWIREFWPLRLGPDWDCRRILITSAHQRRNTQPIEGFSRISVDELFRKSALQHPASKLVARGGASSGPARLVQPLVARRGW